MATNTAGTDAQEYHTKQVHYLRERITGNTAPATNISMGYVPGGSLVVDAYLVLQTAFDGTTVVDIGTAADPDGFATDIATTQVGVIKDTALATSDDVVIGTDTEIVCSIANSASISAGVGWAVVEYMPDLG